jgi:hypothetical protein
MKKMYSLNDKELIRYDNLIVKNTEYNYYNIIEMMREFNFIFI